MIKRYDIEADSIPGNDTWADAPFLSVKESEDGEWVKYEDVKELMAESARTEDGESS